MGKVSKKTKTATPGTAPSEATTSKNDTTNGVQVHDESKEMPPVKDLAAEHLPPIGVVLTIIACSGILFMFAFRDVFATGRNIAGEMDEAYLQFTKSVEFFDNAKGWKSTNGGLSTIAPVTTDANNMGGLFVHKVGGAAALALQVQKLMPVLVHPLKARWKQGHFRPLFWTAVIANLAMVAFYAYYLPILEAVRADGLPRVFMAVLITESAVVASYLYSSRKVTRGPAIAMEDGKTPSSVPSRVVARTVAVCTGAISLIAGRDLFYPGQIIDFIPRDDIYLEWTGAFLHSPPDGSIEAEENAITAAFFVADKFLSQHMALCFLLLSFYKIVSAFFINYGNDGSGEIKARMIWKAQFLGDGLILFLFRLFASAAKSASLDLRWHLMVIAYEACILGLYGFL